MAHLPLQDPGAGVTLLFNKKGLLPNCRHKAVAGGVLLHPADPANSTTGTFLGNTNLLLARQSCHLVPWFALAGGEKNTQSCLLCIIHSPAISQAAPAHAAAPGKGSALAALQRPGASQPVGIHGVFVIETKPVSVCPH